MSNNLKKVILKIEDLKVFKNSTCILKPLKLQVNQNDILALVGPSGCGKHILLRAINQLFSPTEKYNFEGKICIDDVDNKTIPLKKLRQDVGMIFEKPNLFPMSIQENIQFGLRLNGIKNQSILNNKVRMALERVGLWEEVKHKLKQSVFKLNTEQQQRLCLARTLTLNPKIILMDKPTASLNSSSKAHFENLILELKNDYTIIIACEEKQQAGRISNKVAFFFKYNLIEMGETKKVFVQPKEVLTENYITGRIS
jgi:phosphate transport system ATP-binding protein